MRESKVYFENFDALRFVAAFMVLCYHAVSWLKPPDTVAGSIARIVLSLDGSAGDAGVNFFFVLSGFLISYLLFAEQATYRKVSIRHFYIRRILRIWPLYFLTLLIGFVIYPMVAKDFHEQANALLYSLFLANFDNMYGGWPQTGILGVQWSVSVEEQFYLVWPIIFVLFSRGKGFPIVCGALIIGASVFALSGGLRYHPVSCMRELAVGALAAWVSFFHPDMLRKLFGRVSARVTFLIYASGLALMVAHYQLKIHFPFFEHVGLLLQTLLFVFVILEQTFSPNSFLKFGRFHFLSRLGKASYGIYLLHMIAIYAVMYTNERLPMSIWIKLPAAIVLTLALSEISYHFFEKYFLSLKEKFAKVPVGGSEEVTN